MRLGPGRAWIFFLHFFRDEQEEDEEEEQVEEEEEQEEGRDKMYASTNT